MTGKKDFTTHYIFTMTNEWNVTVSGNTQFGFVRQLSFTLSLSLSINNHLLCAKNVEQLFKYAVSLCCCSHATRQSIQVTAAILRNHKCLCTTNKNGILHSRIENAHKKQKMSFGLYFLWCGFARRSQHDDRFH